VIEVSRAVSAHTQMLATLWNRGASILHSEDRDEREQAMLPIFEQIGQVVNDFSVELANAHQIVEDDRLNQALEAVNEAVLMAIASRRTCVTTSSARAHRNPIPSHLYSESCTREPQRHGVSRGTCSGPGSTISSRQR
jgi:hypothetical protein